MKRLGLICLAIALVIVLVTGLILTSCDGPPGADYGEAPDDTLNPGNVFAYPDVVAKFPSLYDTSNSRVLGRKGAHNVEPFEAWMSNTSNILSTTKEDDAKLVDADEEDAEPMLYIEDATNDGFIVVRVVVAPTAPDVVRYINVLIDQNRDGEWRNEPDNPEWVAINHPVRVPPGEARNLIIGPIPLGSDFTLPVWTRISLTNDDIDHLDFDTYVGEETFFDKDGWDGSAPSGGFSGGETEDWLFRHSADVPETNLTAVWGGGAGAPPPIALADTKLAKFTGYGEGSGITKRWWKNVLGLRQTKHFTCEVYNYGPNPVAVNAVDYKKLGGVADLTITFTGPALPQVIDPGQRMEFSFTKKWADPVSVKALMKAVKAGTTTVPWCPNGLPFLAHYKFVFTYDPPPADPFVDEIEDMNELPPYDILEDPEGDLIYVDTGEPVPLEEYLGYVDVTEVVVERTVDTLSCNITVKEAPPEPLEYATFYGFTFDENNNPEDNYTEYPGEGIDTMYTVIYNSMTEEGTIVRGIYEDEGWILEETNANFGMAPSLADGFHISIEIPLTELPELSEILPWKVITETADGPTIRDFAPDEGLAVLEGELGGPGALTNQ